MNKLFILPTGYGKTKTALDILYRVAENQHIVVVVPKLFIIKSWKAEISKWCYDKAFSNIEFITYVGLPKFVELLDDNKHVPAFVFDEAHHLTDKCFEALQHCTWNHAVLLSATVSHEQAELFKYFFKPLEIVRKTINNAISDGRLPDLKIELFPLYLDDNEKSYTMITTQNGKRVKLQLTQRGYYDRMSENIDRLKSMSINNPNNNAFKNLWMQFCGRRLKWLASEKNNVVSDLVRASQNERTIIFCSDIKQSETVCHNSINSKNKDSNRILDNFNNGLINIISACNMLDEGCNLKDCRYGVFVYIPSSNRIQVQRIGRLLRHHDPILRILYYVGTREEEIVNNLIETYNPNLITRREI